MVQGLTESLEEKQERLEEKQEQLEVQKDFARRLAGKLHKLEDRIRAEKGLEAFPMDWDIREEEKKEGEQP